MDLSGQHFQNFLQLCTAQDAQVHLQVGSVVEVHIAGMIVQVLTDGAAGGSHFAHGNTAQRQLHAVDMVLEGNIGNSLIQAFLVQVDDLTGNALTGLTHTGQVEHGGIGLALGRIVALAVGVVQIGFGLDPTDQVNGALIAGGRALGQQEQILTEVLAQFTYMFMHGGLMHIVWNMFALYVFGRIFLDFFSIRHFVGVYLLGGLFGALFFVLAYNLFPYFAGVVDVSHLVGASAAVLAVVTAAAVRSPEYRINMLFFGSVKLSTFAIVTVCISVLMLSGNNAGGNFAHLGGALGGYLFALLLGKGVDLTDILCRPVDWCRSVFGKLKNLKRKKRKFTYSPGGKHGADYEHNAQKKAAEAEVDAILEKIKKGGYASLSEEEKKRLFDASSK